MDEPNTAPLRVDTFDFDIDAEQLICVPDSWLEQHGLNYHHMVSANNFYRYGIQQIITQGFKIERDIYKPRDETPEDKQIEWIKCSVHITAVNLDPPTTLHYTTGQPIILRPKVALAREKVYSCLLKINCEIRAVAHLANDAGQIERIDHINDLRICKVPVIKGSIMCNTYGKSKEALMQMGEDPSDPGGYFIVRDEWAVDCTENMIFNNFKIYTNIGYGNSVARGEFISKPGDSYQNSDQVVINYYKDNTLWVEIARMKYKNVMIPFFLIFRALGWTSDKQIIDHIVEQYDSPVNIPVKNAIMDSFMAPYGRSAYRQIHSQLEACKTIVDLVPEELYKYLDLRNNPAHYDNAVADFLKVVDMYMFPHIGMTSAFREQKLKFLALFIRKLLMVVQGTIPQTDRDSFASKRVHAAGENYAKVFKTYFNQTVVLTITNQMGRHFQNAPFSQVNLAAMVRGAVDAGDFERLMIQSIVAGNKSTLKIKKRTITNRLNAQQLHRKNQLNVYATMRQISATNAESAKQSERAAEMRRVHASQIGFVCVSHSPPEGEKVGINKQLAIFATIAPSSSSEALRDIIAQDTRLLPLSLPPASVSEGNLARVYVNGHLLGYVQDSLEFAADYRRKRRRAEINPYTTIYWRVVEDEVHFYVDYGRLVRPLFIVYNNLRDRHVVTASPQVKFDAKNCPDKGFVEHGSAQAGRLSHGDNISSSTHGSAVADSKYLHATDNPDVVLVDKRAAGEELRRELGNFLEERGREKRGKKKKGGAAEDSDAGALDDSPTFTQGLAVTAEDIAEIIAGRKDMEDMIREQKVEYVSPEEQENCYVCCDFNRLRERRHDELNEYTHCDIPISIVGLTALTAPMGNHNQAPRLTYQTTQGKQTCGYYALNWPFRIDKETFLQYINEMPLVRTLANKYLFPNGTNAMVAIMTYTGFNMEDSLIISKAAIERGFSDGCKFTNFKTKYEQKEKLTNPDPAICAGLKQADYSKLNRGAVRRGTHIVENDVLLGKVVPNPRKDDKPYVDRSVIYDDKEEAVVYNVIEDRNEDDVLFCKVAVRKNRPVQVGDKFCVRENAEVLTDMGWVRITDVKLTDQVAQISENGKLRWGPPSAVHVFDYDSQVDGQLIQWKSGKLEMCCTPKHRVPVYSEECNAEQIMCQITYHHAEELTDTDFNVVVQAENNDIQDDIDANFIDSLFRQIIKTTSNEIIHDLPRIVYHLHCSSVDVLAYEYDLLSERGSKRISKDVAEILCFLSNETIEYRRLLPMNITRIPYKGRVACLTTQTSSFYYREGPGCQGVFTGNSSRSGQKGICALQMREADLPFTANGMRPALIFNPHGIPSRMTTAQLVESLLGNLCAHRGAHIDCTMFKPVDIESIGDELERRGMQRDGLTKMYSGITGELIDTQIFFGPTFYQRLQKFVVDAEFSVKNPLTDVVTQQPLESHSFRLGEMECQSLVSHGASRFLLEKFTKHSDGYTEYICRCGKPAIVNQVSENLMYRCKYCGDLADIVAVPGTWSSKLFMQEMESCGVGIRRIPAPFVFPVVDNEQRDLSIIDRYDHDTVRALNTLMSDMVDDNAAVEVVND